MDGKRAVGFESALLVSWGVIVCAALGAVLAFRIGVHGLGVLLTAVSVTGLVSRLWGLRALAGVQATVTPERETLSVGQSVSVRYTIRNNKALPLVWLELCQDVPARDSLRPDGSFRLRAYTEEEAAHMGRDREYFRRLSFLMGYSTLEWDTLWTGERRGVYRPADVTLRAGDGFGLTQATGTASGLGGRVLVVWPRLVPVQTWPFLRHVWTGAAGRAGWSEDPSVLRGERAYQPGDPWKRIDWRTAARTDELMVRQFDTVTPLSVLFILDAKSLDDAEDGISLLASLIHALCRSGVECGLALPATASLSALTLRPAPSPGQCLFALAAFEAETATGFFDDRDVMAVAAGAGQTWLVSRGAGSMTCPELAGKLSESGVRLLCARRERGVTMTKEYTFDELRVKGGAA